MLRGILVSGVVLMVACIELELDFEESGGWGGCGWDWGGPRLLTDDGREVAELGSFWPWSEVWAAPGAYVVGQRDGWVLEGAAVEIADSECAEPRFRFTIDEGPNVLRFTRDDGEEAVATVIGRRATRMTLGEWPADGEGPWTLEVGGLVTVLPRLYDAEGNELSTSFYLQLWASSDVISVDGNGFGTVFAERVGSATVWARIGGLDRFVEVTVVPAADMGP